MKISHLLRSVSHRVASEKRTQSRKRKPSLELQFLECRTVPAMLDLSTGTVSFTAATGVNDNLSVTLTNGNYTVTDSADTIALTSAAATAGWTGGGTNAVTGPSANVTLLNLNLADGADTLGAIAAGSANVTVSSTGTLDLAGLVTSTGSAGTIAISGAINLTDTTGNGNLQAPTISLSAGSGIGTAGNTLLISGSYISGTSTTTGPTVSAASGAGGVFITSATGINITAAAAGTGNVAITNNSATLNVTANGIDASGAAISGNISLSSGGPVTLNGNIGTPSPVSPNGYTGSCPFTGTITIAGDTLGTLTSATDAYQQNGQSLNTANITAAAATITVNTPAGGTGAASIGDGSIGNLRGGTITVQSYNANIVWCNTTAAQAVLGTWDSTDPRTGIDSGGLPSNSPQYGTGGTNSALLTASNYVFTTTGSSSEIGSSARPIQAADFSPGIYLTSASPQKGSATLAAGSGGIYFVDWAVANENDMSLTLDSAIASGGGSIRVVAAHASGHDIFVAGPVWTHSGSIEIYSDDDISLQGATVGGVYQGSSFSGTVDLEANRDFINGQSLNMKDNSSIATANATGSAILLTNASAVGSTGVVDTLIPAGGIDLENVSCGNGGTITIDAAAGTASNRQGSIIQQNGTSIYAGPNGKVSLTARASSTANTYLLGGIGVTGTPSNPNDEYPVNITAGSVTATTGGSSTANINIEDTSTTSALTISSVSTGSSTQVGGSVILAGTDAGGGVVVSGTLGSSTTGAITVNGPLSGSGSIVLGTNKLTVNQDTTSEFDGVISGNHSVTLGGSGSLLLTATQAYTLGTTIQAGSTLLVNGSIVDSSGVTIAPAGVLAGNNGTVGTVTANGVLAPGNLGVPGILNTGTLSFASSGAFAVTLERPTPGSGYSQAVASGAVSLGGAALNISIGSAIPVLGPQPASYDILENASGQAINGTFAGLPEGAIAAMENGFQYKITYHGGASGEDVVLTLFGSVTLHHNPLLAVPFGGPLVAAVPIKPLTPSGVLLRSLSAGTGISPGAFMLGSERKHVTADETGGNGIAPDATTLLDLVAP